MQALVADRGAFLGGAGLKLMLAKLGRLSAYQGTGSSNCIFNHDLSALMTGQERDSYLLFQERLSDLIDLIGP